MYRYKLLIKKYAPLAVWIIIFIIMAIVWTQNLMWLTTRDFSDNSGNTGATWSIVSNDNYNPQLTINSKTLQGGK